MKNIIKIRIIHDINSNPEEEYLTEFFRYIGLLVYDETVYNQYDMIHHLKLQNDNDGVDIILNHFSRQDYSTYPRYNNRIYLYINLEKGICEVSKEPLSSPNELQARKKTKRETRIEALNLLINTIWKDDEENRKAINQIREYYAPQEEDRDLFFILQATSCCSAIYDIIFFELGNHSEGCVKHLFLNDDYVKKIFRELWRMQCLLKDIDNPYAIYTEINTAMTLLKLLQHTNINYHPEEFNSIKYDDKKIKISSAKTIFEKIQYKLLKKYYWFTSGYFMMLQLNNNQGMKPVFDYLINQSHNSFFPTYYSYVYYQMGLMTYEYALSVISNNLNDSESVNKVLNYFNIALKLDPLNSYANFNIELMNFLSGKFNDNRIASSIETKNPLINFCYSTNRFENIELLSLKEIIIGYCYYYLMSVINLNSYREYFLRGTVSKCVFSAYSLGEALSISKISDTEEKAYQEFIEYNRYSTPLFDLCAMIKSWVNNIINDDFIKSVFEEILSRWGTKRKNEKK